MMQPIKVKVDFRKVLRTWDGFGFNYVETAQTRNYEQDKQDYGGFSYLEENERREIVNLVFGEEGLCPGLLKMFQDPFHEPQPGQFDHARTTHWMRYFAREGLKATRQNGSDLKIVVTLYSPPAWMTKQGVLRGRDLAPAFREECAEYMVSWANYLRQEEKLPVKYISLHNEGEDWVRWPEDGGDGLDWQGHDYNLHWPPEQVVDFVKLVDRSLKKKGINDIGVTCGETSNWLRFSDWGYADAIADDLEAVSSLGLITSHGFYGASWNRWHGDWRSVGIDTIRNIRPELHAWVTSTSWSKMDVEFVNEIRNNIYAAKVNGIIPWAGVQVRGKWVGGDPNPGTAIVVNPQGGYEIQPGYWYYKQMCRAGQPGMGVARASVNETILSAIAFSGNGTRYPHAIVLNNLDQNPRRTTIKLNGCSSQLCQVYRTSPKENYEYIGDQTIHESNIEYTAPGRSVTTFFCHEARI